MIANGERKIPTMDGDFVAKLDFNSDADDRITEDIKNFDRQVQQLEMERMVMEIERGWLVKNM